MERFVTKPVRRYLYFACCFAMIIVSAGCSRSEKEPLPSPPTLSVSPGLSITIPYYTSATFSWTTNGRNVTVNAVAQTGNSFTTPLLKTSTNYTIFSESPNFANDGLYAIAVVEVKVLPNDPATVYVAGSDNGHVVYWKDTTEHLVSPYPPYSQSRPSGIAFAGQDLYLVGYSRFSAAYWKNGVETSLSSGQGHSYASSIFVAGSDVYIGGNIRTNQGFQSAAYWKNGVPVILETAYANESAGVEGIAVSAGIVYAVGHVQGTPILWTNGVKTVLGGRNTVVLGIAISGNDVFMVGREYPKPVYWKNGVKTILPCAGVGTANAIAISGSDIHIAGHDGDYAVYWKNGLQTALSTSRSSASSITTFGGDVYIAGIVRDQGPMVLNQAVYWKDGVRTTLPAFTPNTGIATEAQAILVMKR